MIQEMMRCDVGSFLTSLFRHGKEAFESLRVSN
jgi:hypothetical protein